MKAGLSTGIILFVLGTILLGVYYMVATEWDRVPRILVASPTLIILGIAMMLFPGGDYYFKDLAKSNGKAPLSDLLKAAPMLHKVAWLVGLGLGLVSSLMLLTS